MKVKKTKLKGYFIIFSILLLFVSAYINANLVQTFSFAVIVIFAIIFYCKNIKIMTLIFSYLLLCLLLFQYLIVLGYYNISTLAVISIICYYLVYLALFLELLTISGGKRNNDVPVVEKLFFKLVISFFMVAFLLGNYELKRFAGPFENVLNFTGVIAVIFSFYLIKFGVSVRSIVISIFVLIFGILSMSKILILLWIMFIIIVILKDTRYLIVSCVCLLAFLVVYSDWINFYLEIIFRNLSITNGPIMHRLDRYSNISYFNMTGIPHAQTTVCSHLMEKTCITSESFILGFILTYGIAGILALFPFLYNIKNVKFAFILVFSLLTGGLNTPYTIMVLWSLIKIYQSFVCNIEVRLDSAIKGTKKIELRA